MAAYLMKRRLHRLVPGSSQAPTSEEVDAAWGAAGAGTRSDPRLGAIDADAHRDRADLPISERRPGRLLLGGPCAAAAKMVEKMDLSIGDPLTHAGVCIEWAEREHRQWFWRCTRDHQLL